MPAWLPPSIIWWILAVTGSGPSPPLCAALVLLLSPLGCGPHGWFRIPTSESHALITGLSGAAVAIHNSFCRNQRLRMDQGYLWPDPLHTFGFPAGLAVGKNCGDGVQNMDRAQNHRIFSGAQIAGRAAMAFMHGAQDGQKFMDCFHAPEFSRKRTG